MTNEHIEEVRKKLNTIYLRLAYGKSDINKTKQEVDLILSEALKAEGDRRVEELTESVAKAIYAEMVCDDPRGKPDWVEGGNMIKQVEARLSARKAITNNN